MRHRKSHGRGSRAMHHIVVISGAFVVVALAPDPPPPAPARAKAHRGRRWCCRCGARSLRRCRARRAGGSAPETHCRGAGWCRSRATARQAADRKRPPHARVHRPEQRHRGAARGGGKMRHRGIGPDDRRARASTATPCRPSRSGAPARCPATPRRDSAARRRPARRWRSPSSPRSFKPAASARQPSASIPCSGTWARHG